MDDVAILIRETITTDEHLNNVTTEEERTVMVQSRAITRREFYDAANQGLKPEVAIWLSSQYDYQGEKLVKFHGKTYTVLRTYQPAGSDELELTLQEKVSDYE